MEATPQSTATTEPLITTKTPPPSYDTPVVYTNTEPKKWSEFPERITCTNCRQEVVTEINQKIGLGSWVAVGIVAWVLLAFGLLPCIPFALLVLLMGFTKDKQHVCPNCGFINGEKKLYQIVCCGLCIEGFVC